MAKDVTITLKKMLERDLEIVMAWRSHPMIYKFFQIQDGPLTWKEHLNFWLNRTDREDYIINYKEGGRWRKVGNINLSALNSEYPEIGIFIGEITLQGKGVGTKAVELILKRLKKLGHTKAHVSIHVDNIGSKKIFSKFNFIEAQSGESPWKKYFLESIVL